MLYVKAKKNVIALFKMASILLLVFAAAMILQNAGQVNSAIAAENEKHAGQYVQKELSFENRWVEAGVPLKVLNAPKAALYHWTITSADGKEKTFTTTKNAYTPTKEDRETLITVSLDSCEYVSASIYYSSLSVIYIENINGYSGVEDYFTGATIKMQGNNNFSDKKELYNGNIGIKLRGNSTKHRLKRPFNIKLDKKTDLLGMGKNKHWALLANDIDHTLMRNKLLFDFSGAIGMDSYIKSENVVLVFNNEYEGVYQLCELVDIGSDRVDVYDWEERAEDVADSIVDEFVGNGKITKDIAPSYKKRLEDAMCEDLRWITSPYTFTYDVDVDGNDETYKITDYSKLPQATGGVLLEMDFFAFQGEDVSTMVSAYSQPWYFKAPEYAITNNELYDYIDKYVQSFEYALHNPDFIYHENSIKYNAINRNGGSNNPGYKKSDFTAREYNGKHYSELFDMDSLVQNFILCEYAMNWDGMKNSVFMYKDTDGLFHMGPEWDFDWVWGNINMFQKNTWFPTSWQTTQEAFAKEQYYQTVQWNRCLIRDPYFLVRVYEKYKEIRGTIIEDMIKDGGVIDTYAKALKLPGAANDVRWGDTYSDYHSVGFKESVINMKKFIHTRINWMDQQFESIDTLIASLGYYKPDDELKIGKIDSKKKKGNTLIEAKVTNPDITSVVFQINGTKMYTAKVKAGKAVCSVPVSALVNNKERENVVQILALDSDGNYLINSQDKGNYSMVKSNYAVFDTGERYNYQMNVYYFIAFTIIIIIIIVIFLRSKTSRNKLCREDLI